MYKDQTDIVLFFCDGVVSQQMLKPEFEALLDQVICLPEYADTEAKLVFARVNFQLQVTATVFFLLKFDSRGAADRRWNLALEHLAEHTSLGPNMGAGPIRLSCRSQCSVSWHQNQLWDPELGVENNTLKIVSDAVKKNTLGLQVSKGEKTAEIDAGKRDLLAAQLKKQRLQIASLKNKERDKARQWQRDAQLKITELEQRLAQTQQTLKLASGKELHYKNLLEKQQRKLREDRAHYMQALQKAKTVDSQELINLEQRLEAEFSARIISSQAELETELAVKTMELAYSEELAAGLHQDFEQQQARVQSILNQNSASYLAQLEETGVRFIAFHEGAGHIPVSRLDVGRYLDSPIAFAASYCGVDKSVYKHWLAHFKRPQCSAHLANGKHCEQALTRVDSPEEFVVMYSDRCEKHQNYRGSLRSA